MAESSSSGEESGEEEEHDETSPSLRGPVSPITAASKVSENAEKKLRYFSERGYLKTLSQQKRQRIEQEIREGHIHGKFEINFYKL